MQKGPKMAPKWSFWISVQNPTMKCFFKCVKNEGAYRC